jgi:hypothetical protein
MFKKSLIALGVLAVATSASAASTLVGSGSNKTGTTVSAQGFAAGAAVESGNFVYTVQGSSTQESAIVNSLDYITLTFDNAVISAASSFAVQGANSNSMSTSDFTVTYPSASSIKLVPTVAHSGANAFASGTTLTFSGLKLLPTETASGSTIGANVNFVSKVAGSSLQSASGNVATFISEFYAAVNSKFDAKIDVAKDREGFEGSTFDYAKVTVSDLSPEQANVTTNKVEFVWSGDFDFLDNDGDGKFGEAGEGTIAASASGAVTLSYNGVEASGSTTSAGSSYISDMVVTPSLADTANVVTPQSMTATAVVTYNTTKKESFADVPVGVWELNAASTTIDYLPFGTNYAHAISVHNPSAADGEISIVLTANGKTYSKSLTTMAAAKSITQIGKDVSDFAAASGVTEAALQVIVNAKNVVVKGLYYAKSDGDRVLMN